MKEFIKKLDKISNEVTKIRIAFGGSADAADMDRMLYDLDMLICKEIDNLSVSQKKDICEKVIHHTCKHFNQITGCSKCEILKFESKY